jgi:hypothetical protein
MDPTGTIETLKSFNYLNLFFKAIALIFSLGYLVYGVVFLQQQNKMEKNALIYEHLLDDPTSNTQQGRSIIFALALLQLTVGLVLLFTSLVLL